MDGIGPDWKGLLKWSIANSDGTQAPREVRFVEFVSVCDFTLDRSAVDIVVSGMYSESSLHEVEIMTRFRIQQSREGRF